jgi:hypothetical protein
MILLLFNRFLTQLSKKFVSSPQVNFLRLAMLAVFDQSFQLEQPTSVIPQGQVSLSDKSLSKVFCQVNSTLSTS